MLFINFLGKKDFNNLPNKAARATAPTFINMYNIIFLHEYNNIFYSICKGIFLLINNVMIQSDKNM